jgi:hypothetical protein
MSISLTNQVGNTKLSRLVKVAMITAVSATLLAGCATEPPTGVDSAVLIPKVQDTAQSSAPAALEPTPEPQDVTPLDPETPSPSDFEPVVRTSLADMGTLKASEVLEQLPTKGRAPKTGYDRKAKFGTPWMDMNRNGCDTRNDILRRDLIAPTPSGPCKILAGVLEDNYTGESIDFVRGNTTSTLVQIDHLVSLSDAWQKGAQLLSQQQRITFANDPLNLETVDGPTNSAKGAGDAATWLPPNRSFRCEYVARQISVKATYSLWVTAAEKQAMARVLEECPGQMAYASSFAPALQSPVVQKDAVKAPAPIPVPVPAPAPDQVPVPAPSQIYFSNCTEARAAGAAPVSAGQPGYGRHLDRDGDGVGCE